jgi:hypothetical protein
MIDHGGIETFVALFPRRQQARPVAQLRLSGQERVEGAGV